MNRYRQAAVSVPKARTHCFLKISSNSTLAASGGGVNNFGVQDSVGSTVRGVSFSVAGNWQPSGNTALQSPIAQFVPHMPLPEPTTFLLLGLGLAGLAARKHLTSRH